MLERSGSDLTLAEQADLLSVSRSSLYYVPRAPSEWEVRIKHRIDVIYTDLPFYGSRRITNALQEEGFEIGRDGVRQFMREMGIEAIYPKPNLSKPAPENKVYPYLLRGVTSAYPNHNLGHRHHLHPFAAGLDVPGGYPGLVLPLHRQLGTLRNSRDRFRAHMRGSGARRSGAHHL